MGAKKDETVSSTSDLIMSFPSKIVLVENTGISVPKRKMKDLLIV